MKALFMSIAQRVTQLDDCLLRQREAVDYSEQNTEESLLRRLAPSRNIYSPSHTGAHCCRLIQFLSNER